MDLIITLLIKLFGKNPFVIAAAIVGGVGILNVIDSLFGNIGLFSDWLRAIFIFIRDWWRPLLDKVIRYLPFQISDPIKDYILMGCIVVGMRLRSSMVIWRSLNNQGLSSYTQKTILPDYPLVLRKDESLKFYGLFLPIRLGWAFVGWPEKVFGAAWRYGSGKLRIGGTGQGVEEITQEQYLTFFGSVFWALFLLLAGLLIRF